MIRLDNVSLAFGSKTIFDNVSLHIRKNDRIGLIGPNGTGKSTLFKLICRFIESSAGDLIYAKDANVGYLPQEGFVFKKKTVFEEASSAFEDIFHLKSLIDKIHTQMEDPTIQGEDHQLLLDHYAH